jgi:hypothetical protein
MMPYSEAHAGGAGNACGASRRGRGREGSITARRVDGGSICPWGYNWADSLRLSSVAGCETGDLLAGRRFGVQ